MALRVPMVEAALAGSIACILAACAGCASPAVAPEPLMDVPIARQHSGRVLMTTPALSSEHEGHVIVDQAAYDAFVARLPKLRIQKKQPSPPNTDPLLNKPAIDFDRQMLVVTTRRSMYYGPTIASVRPGANGGLVVEVVQPGMEGVVAMASRDDVGTYAAVVVPRRDGPVVFRVTIAARPSGR